MTMYNFEKRGISTRARRPTRNGAKILYLFPSILLLNLLLVFLITYPDDAYSFSGDYISDRFCQKVGGNISQLIATQNTTGEIQLATFQEREGIKHPFWIQCYRGNSSAGRSSQHRVESLDSDLISGWLDSVDFVDELQIAPIQDERYNYLLSVSKRCEPFILKHCNSYKIGLLSQNSGRCRSCGSNDINCDNVSQCTSDCGQIKSINYPHNYGNNHRCRWSLRAPSSYYVNLSIIDFDIPSANNNASKLGTCIFDYLTLIDGYTGKRIGCYCNENLPPPYIVSPWNELIVQFDTNSEMTGRGFLIEYQFIKLELSEKIKSQLTLSKNSSVCLNGWQYFRESCYRAIDEKEPLQWYDAENKCTTIGEGLDGHLVSILDKDEMLVILYWLTNVWKSPRYREYYIGLIDASREGLYRWSDQNPMSYTDWELKPLLLEDETPAQPDGGAYEDCTVIRYDSFSRTSNWHDVPCSLGKHYHSHLDKTNQSQSFKWDYVTSYICKSDSFGPVQAKVRRPLFSNVFPPLHNDYLPDHLTGHGDVLREPTNSLVYQTTTTNLPEAAQQSSSTSFADKAESPQSLSQQAVALVSGQHSTNTSLEEQNKLHLSTLDSNRFFICDNLQVISTVLRCDAVAHCRDSSDEKHGCSRDSCLDWQFRCKNGRCIPIGYYCDFKDDCGDGSDESHCERLRCKLNEFRCQSGQCIQANQRCDLLPDCFDSSDEGKLCTESNCNPTTTFQCYNGNCIPQYAVCDFQIDCPGKFHEDEDVATCDLLQKSQATMSNKSIAPPLIEANAHNSLNGDGMSSSPVVFYPANKAASIEGWMNLFKCKSGNMIDSNLKCLFEFDKYGYQIGCRDVSHLIDCANFECPKRDYVKCPNSYCIPWRYVCDGKSDCVMGDDEVNCSRYVCPGQYKCASHEIKSSCIPLHQLCDGHRQCPMGDDEWFCDLHCPPNCSCVGQSVNCRNANMTSLPGNYISKSVRKLDLSYNHLGPNLSNSNFDAYHDLGELILNHNRITILTPRKFVQLKNLYKLDLSHNQIHSVTRGAFAGLRRVTQLWLESNDQLSILDPEAFLGLSSLEMLNISSSKISTLRKNTFLGLSACRHLFLRSNMLVTIEDGAFRSLTSLVGLDMRGNDIKHFTKSVFSELKSLRNLSTDSFKFCCLVNHQIASDRCLPLPDEISDCEDLLSSVPQRTCIWIAGGFACFGNLLVIIWRYRDRLGQKEREVERINSTLLLSLGCSDFLMGIYLVIIAIVDSWYRGRYIENVDQWRESPLCNACGFLSTISSTVSVLTLVFMAYNRYLEIRYPMTGIASCKFTLGYTQRLLRVAWCSALAIATAPLVISPYFRGQFYARSGVCLAFHITDRNAPGWLYTILTSPCLNLSAFVFIFVCYMRIYRLLNSRAVLGNHHHAERPKHHIIFLNVLVPFVAFSPPIIIGFMSLVGYTPPAALYSWIAVLVLPVNSAINPIIYTIPDIVLSVRELNKHWKARKSGASAAAAARLQSAQARSANNGNNSAASQTRKISSLGFGAVGYPKELIPMLSASAELRQRLAQRNVPPGYLPVKQFISLRTKRITVRELVEIALSIVSDIEQKHRDAKVYVSLSLDDIFVSDSIKQTNCETSNERERNSDNKLAVFLADYDGYRLKRSQPCSHVEGHNSLASPASGHHFHQNHKSMLNCECSDVNRFGDLLFKLIQLYNNRKLERRQQWQ